MKTDLANLTQLINDLLARIDSELTLAKKALGIRPDLKMARVHTLTTSNTVMALTGVLVNAQADGIMTPPDVIYRVNTAHEEMDKLCTEILFCESVMRHSPESKVPEKAISKNTMMN